MPGPATPEIKPPPPKSDVPKLRGSLPERRKQFRESKGVIEGESVNGKEKKPSSAEAEETKQLADAEGVDDVAIAAQLAIEAKASNPDLAREVLLQAASLASTRILDRELRQLEKRPKTDGKDKKNLLELKRKVKKARENEVKVKLGAEKLIGEGVTPEERVLGHDISVALEQRAVSQLQESIREMKTDLKDKTMGNEEKATIEKAIEDAEVSVKAATTRITELKEKRSEFGENLPNEVEGLVRTLLGNELGSTDKENPLGVLENFLTEMTISGDDSVRKVFIGRLQAEGVFESREQLKEFDEAIAAPEVHDYKKLALTAGKGAGLFVVLLAWIAAKSAMGGVARGQGH